MSESDENLSVSDKIPSGFNTPRSESPPPGVHFKNLVNVRHSFVPNILLEQGAKPFSIDYVQQHSDKTNRNKNPRTRPPQVPRPNIPIQPSTTYVNNAPKASASKSNAAPQSNSDYYNHLLTQMYKEIENIEKSNNIPGPDKITLTEEIIAHYGALGELYGLKQSGRGRKTRRCRSNRKSKRKTKRSHARRA